MPRLDVDARDQVRREVDDLLEVLGRQVEQVAQARRDALEVPDVGDGRGQLDVAHPLTTHLGAGHLDAAALADDALEADALVLAAVALPVAGRTEDLLAEEPVLLRLEGAVVDGLGLLDLAVGPLRMSSAVARPMRSSSKKLTSSTVPSLLLACSGKSVGGGPAGYGGRRVIRRTAVPDAVRPLRRSWAHVGTGRCRAPPLRGRRPRRCRASRWPCRRWRAPRRSGTATASP